MIVVVSDSSPLRYLLSIGDITAPDSPPPGFRLHYGEHNAIHLAGELNADLLLMDDRAAVLYAEQQGFRVAGTLAILARASRQRLIDFDSAIARLRATNFRMSEDLIQIARASAL